MPLAPIIDDGDWGDIIKPEIREYYPYADEDTDKIIGNTISRQVSRQKTVKKAQRSRRDLSKLEVYLRLRRVIIVQLETQPRDEYGFGRHLEGGESNDFYTVYIKCPNFDDITKVFKKMRKIFVGDGSDRYYAKILVPNSRLAQGHVSFVRTCQVTASLDGKVFVDA